MTETNKRKARVEKWDYVLDVLADAPNKAVVPVSVRRQKGAITQILINSYQTYYREEYKSAGNIIRAFLPKTDEERQLSYLLPQFYVIKAVRHHKIGKPGMDTSLLPLFEFMSTKRCADIPEYPKHRYDQELVMLQALMREAPEARTLEVLAKLADSRNCADVRELKHVTQKGGYDPKYMRSLRTSARSVAKQLDELHEQFARVNSKNDPETTDAPVPNDELLEQLKQERQRVTDLEKALVTERQRRETAEAERDRAIQLRDNAVAALDAMNNAQSALHNALHEIKDAIGGQWEDESMPVKAA